MQHDRTGYCHSYHWDQWCPVIKRAIDDSARQRLVEQLQIPPQKLTSEGLAVAIADALIHEGLLNQGLQAVVPVIRSEIQIRKFWERCNPQNRLPTFNIDRDDYRGTSISIALRVQPAGVLTAVGRDR